MKLTAPALLLARAAFDAPRITPLYATHAPAAGFRPALPPHQSAATANRRSVAARDQARRFPRRRAQGRRARAALQPTGNDLTDRFLLIVEAVARLRARARR